MSTVFEGVTIDPVSAKDLDDAIWVSRDGHGWIVQVAFPRLVEVAPAGGKIDLSARTRLATAYRANGGVIHMLPFEVVEKASLTRGSRKDVFLVTIRIGRSFEVEATACELATFKNISQLSYDLASDLVRSGTGEIGQMLGQARDLAYGLFEKRRASGAIAYYDFERGVAFDEEGSVILLSGEGHVAEMIVAEFMILANSSLASWANHEGIPILYRNHGREAAMTRAQVLANLEGVTSDANVALRSFPRLLKRATIGVRPEGHYGLALSAYAWFTSPLRRYADLVNQRMIMAHLTAEPAVHNAEALEQIAHIINQKAENDATSAAEHFKTKALQDAEKLIKKGTVSGATEQDFGRVVKVLSENPDAMNKAVEDESLRRIAAGSVTSKEMTRLLLLGGRIGEAVIARLTENSNESIGVLMYGATTLGWGTPRFEDTIGGPAHARIFAAKGFVKVANIEHSTPPMVRTSKKAAQQAAGVHLLALIAGIATPKEPDETVEVAESPKPAPKPAPKPEYGVAEQNPKNRLQEFLIKRKAPLPVFQVTECGPPNDRTFTAVAVIEIGGRKQTSRPASARSRKEAEKEAAAKMLAVLENSR